MSNFKVYDKNGKVQFESQDIILTLIKADRLRAYHMSLRDDELNSTPVSAKQADYLGYIDVPTQDDVLGFIHYDASVTDNLGLRYAFSDAVGLSYRGKVKLKNGGARHIFASHYYMSDTRLEQYRVYFFGRYTQKAKVGLTTYDTDGNITYTSDGHALKLKKVISPLYVPKNKVDKQKVIESLDLVSYAGMYHTLAQELGIDSGRYDDETCIQKMLELISQKYANPNFSFKTGNRPNEFANEILKAAMGLDDSQPELAWFYRTLGDCNYHLMQQGRKYATSLSTTGLTHQYDTNGLWHIIYVGFTPLGLNSGIIYTGAIHNHMFYQEPIEVYERIIRYAGQLRVSYYSHSYTTQEHILVADVTELPFPYNS